MFFNYKKDRVEELEKEIRQINHLHKMEVERIKHYHKLEIEDIKHLIKIKEQKEDK